MKKIFKNLRFTSLIMLVFLVSCGSPNSLNKKATEIAKSFYTDYLKACDTVDEKKILNVKKTYMTDTMVEETILRTKQIEADIVTGVQDSTDMIKKMVVTDGEDEDWAIVTFDMMEEEGKPYRIYEIKMHFRDVDKKRLIDTLDLTIYDVDADGDKVKTENKTRWANKPELSENDKAEMQRMKEYYDELAEAGYIG